MKFIKIIIFLGMVFVYFYYILKYDFKILGKKYNIKIREKEFREIAEPTEEILFSYEVSQLIPKEIFRKTKWFKKYGNGWFDFVVKMVCNKFSNIFFCEFSVLRKLAAKIGLLDIHITILIIKQKGIDSTNIQKSILSKKFYSIYKKRSKVKIETIEDYTFIWFDAPLNLESLKILKKCAI